MSLAVYLEHRSGVLTSTLTESLIDSVDSLIENSGNFSGTLYIAETSRAMPITLKQSDLFGVIPRSRTVSERFSASFKGVPGVRSGERCMIPSAFVPRPSSGSEHIIP